jgi:hypothetical protein
VAPGDRDSGLAGILRRYQADYLATHELSAAQAKVWRAITACRTPALGGHIETCQTCGIQRALYHSCRNRHCPLCQTRAKEAWLAQRRSELLPVPYFHLVFTLPHDLNGFIAYQPRQLYETLFGAVAATLTAFAANPRWLGGTPSFTLVLHTWKQDLGRHVHVHALVAGGALGKEGHWHHAKRGFLFPVRALSAVFRGKFVDTLKRAHGKGQLRVDEEATPNWPALLERLYRHDWVVYAKQPLGGPAQVLEYLARYTHRVAISNERIVSFDKGMVSFRVRKNPDESNRRIVRLPAVTFIERFLMHVLPRGFKRIRHYGLLAPAHKASRLERAREVLGAPSPNPVAVESIADFMRRTMRLERWTCPCCGSGRLFVSAVLPPQRGSPDCNHRQRAPP